MMKLSIVSAVTCVLIGCVDGDRSTGSLTTEHATAIVHSEATATGIATTVVALDDDTALAAIELDGAAGTATLVWPDGAHGAMLVLPSDFQQPALGEWNVAAYVFYQLETWKRTGTEEVELCHQNAAGAGCRGACGVDCDSCKTNWVCAPNAAHCGGAGAALVWFKQYRCYERPCCVTHDACYDACNGGFWCMRGCDVKAKKAGCNMDDANGNTWARSDATRSDYYHPTAIPCAVAGAVTLEEPVATTPAPVVPPGAGTEPVPGPGSATTDDGPVNGTIGAAGCDPTGPPAPPAEDRICTDQDDWTCQVNFCPEDASCASCVWGS